MKKEKLTVGMIREATKHMTNLKDIERFLWDEEKKKFIPVLKKDETTPFPTEFLNALEEKLKDDGFLKKRLDKKQ